MLKRSLVYVVLTVCVFSFFSIKSISYAGPSLGDWINAARKVDNAKSIMETERNQYHSIRSDLDALIGEWDDAEQSKATHDLLSVIAVAGAIVSVASGGSLYPAAYVIAVTEVKAGYTQSKYNVQKEKYLTSMSSLLSLMDTARSNVDAAYNGGYLAEEPSGGYIGTSFKLVYTAGYVPEYDAYLGMAVTHLNGHEYYVGKYGNKVELKFEALESAVKGGSTSGYYHRKAHYGDKDSKVDHIFSKFMTFADFTVKPDLPYNYVCKGACGTLFRTPYEAFWANRVQCGSAGQTIDDEARLHFANNGGSLASSYLIVLNNRKSNPSQGCGEWYYTCKDSDKHRLRHADDSGDPYRNCLGGVNSIQQQSVAPSPGLSPANGSSNPTASPGDTHEAKLVTSEPYYYVRWYVKGPGDTSSLGTLVETDEGWSTGTETEASLSYTFSSSAASGDWTITAVSQRYSDLSKGSTRSYTVTVK